MLLAHALLATTDWIARPAIVQGYNSNTYQAQDDPNLPIIRRHPSLFTGVDLQLEMRSTSPRGDLTVLRVDGRGNHYEPLNNAYQSDDGAVSGELVTRHTLDRRTFVSASLTGSITTLNGSHLTDGTIFSFDPTQVRRTYWLSDDSVALSYELSKRWRISQSLGIILGGTVSQPATLTASGQPMLHRGLDYATPYVQTDLSHDFNERTNGDAFLLAQLADQVYVLDLTQNPPRNAGPTHTESLTAMAGASRQLSLEWSASAHAGGVLATPDPADIDQRPILAPAMRAQIDWTKPMWSMVASTGYTYGTVNPRLGSGPSADASVLVVGVPYPVGKWKELTILMRGQVSWSTIVTGPDRNLQLGFYGTGAEARYGINGWLGLLGGFEVRYATYGGSGAQPPFLQTITFVGLAGFFSTDRGALPLSTVVAPVSPPS
jgi:hypothetical protein